MGASYEDDQLINDKGWLDEYFREMCQWKEDYWLLANGDLLEEYLVIGKWEEYHQLLENEGLFVDWGTGEMSSYYINFDYTLV